MPLLKHKGGSLAIPGTDIVLHYGPGLHRACPECNQPKNKLCLTKAGKPLKNIHKARKD